MMNVPQTSVETEEDLLTCLHIKLFHPQQCSQGLYRLLPLEGRVRQPAEDPLRLGRDCDTCTFALFDPRVSRKQLSVQAYRTAHSPDMLFSIQNLSQRGSLSVNGALLGYLERTELPDKALVRFGEYQLLMVRESGDAKGSFEVHFEVLPVSPCRETCADSLPVIEIGALTSQVTSMSVTDESRPFNGPLESDETLVCLS